jgi:hypothetical protein
LKKYILNDELLSGIIYSNKYYFSISSISIIYVTFYSSSFYSYVFLTYLLFITFFTSLTQYFNIYIKVIKDSIIFEKRLKNSLSDYFSELKILEQVSDNKILIDKGEISSIEDYYSFKNIEYVKEEDLKSYSFFLDRYIPIKMNKRNVFIDKYDNYIYNAIKSQTDRYFKITNFKTENSLILEQFIEITIIILLFGAL